MPASGSLSMTPAGARPCKASLISGVLLLLAAGSLLGWHLADTASHEWYQNLHLYGDTEDDQGHLYSLLSTWSEDEKRFVLSFSALILPAALLCAASGWLLVGDWRDRLGRFIERLPGWLPATGFPLLVTIEILLAAILVLKCTPITDDEFAYLFQARILARGALYLPSQPPLPRPHFDNIFIVNSGKWFTQYPFGHPLLLLPGVLLGLPVLMPALLGGMTMFMSHGTAEHLFGRRTAFITAVMLCLSPFFIFTSATLLSHTSTLFLLALFTRLFIRALDTARVRDWLGAGAILGALVHFRPHLPVLFGAPFGMLLVYLQYRSAAPTGAKRLSRFRSPAFWRQPLYLAAGSAIPIAMYLVLNLVVNGNPMITNYDAYWEPSFTREEFQSTSVLGFGTYPWGIAHTPALGLRNTWLNLLRLAFWLLGNPLALIPLLFSFRGSSRDRPWLTVFITLPVFFFGFHFFYFWPGISDTGPVFSFELIPWVLMVAAHGFWSARKPWGRFVANLAAAAVIAGWFGFLPVQVKALERTQAAVNEPYVTLAKWAAEHAPGEPLLVFMEYNVQPHDNARSWVMGRPNPLPDLSDRFLCVLDLGETRNGRLAERFPDRSPVRLIMKEDRRIRIRRLEFE
ncbi:glycosyltransferase family 39 protein [bacterium]|nr:glycosyltransferase family 39 protein [candidate division CSSED10-310 bacterium]